MREATFPIEFEAILGDIQKALADGDLERATALADQAIAWGERHGDRDAVDRGLCNRASFRLARGELDGLAREQQAVLMRSQVPATEFQAAYNLSILFDLRQDAAKSAFYGRLALEHANASGERGFRTQARNHLANLLLSDSYFEEALEHYEQALDDYRAKNGLVLCREHALVLANSGYCQLVLGEVRAGLGRLFAALRALRRMGALGLRYYAGIHLSICYGFIELGRIERARRHAEAALDAAERAEQLEWVKKALYLLGEVEKRSGASLTAYSHFRRLQNEFFPDNVGLAGMLMQAETHRLVNLLA